MARGANLADKINHAVYKTIKQASTPDAVRGGKLFTLDTFVPDIVNLTKNDLKAVLRRLIGDRVAAQIFRLEFDPGKSAIKLTPCFISNPKDDKDVTLQLYSETMYQSIQALESYLDSLAAATPETVWKDLEHDLDSEKIPKAQEFLCSVTDLFKVVHPANFDIIPSNELITASLNEMRYELNRKGRIVEINDYGFMPVRDSEVIIRLETAGDFLKRKVIPRYKSRGNCKRELEQIDLEEAGYRADPFAAPTGEFIAKRAQAVKKAVLATPGPEGIRFPGTLAVETVLGMEPFARARYGDMQRKKSKQELQKFKEKLLHPGLDWNQAIRFVEQEEVYSYPPELWKSLLTADDLLHGIWELPDRSIHMFVRNDASSFRILVNGMNAVPPEQRWKVLAMKTLLDTYEDQMSELFEDQEFVAAFGRLIREAYFNYMPWYHRLLLFFGITMLQDSAFQIAKQKIQIQQKVLEKLNQQKNDAIRKNVENEKKAKLSRVKDLAASNEIVEKLDFFYLNEKIIPTVGDVKDALPEIDPKTFFEILKKEKFQILPAPRGTDPNQGILLYPMNYEWRTKAARLRRALDVIIAEWQESGPGEDQTRALATANRVSKYLSRAESGGGGSAPSADQGDPYEAFEKELKKHEDRERKLAPVNGDDDF